MDTTAHRPPTRLLQALYSPLDGHVNSLKLFRALCDAGARHGIDFRPNHAVETITARDGGFRVSGTGAKSLPARSFSLRVSAMRGSL